MMRVVRFLKAVLRWSPPLVLAAVFALFGVALLNAPEGVGQVVERVRFRVVQTLDEPVIDLEDASPSEVPRYNTFAVADIDGGGPDIVAINNEDDVVNVYLGNGDGTFEDPIGVEIGDATFPVAVVVEDFTGPFDQNGGAPDGNLDLFVIDDLGTIALLVGDGDGDFAQPDQTIEFVEDLADFISGAVSGDFDGDGNPDVAIADDDEIIFVCNNSGTMVPCATENVILSDVFSGALVVDIQVGDFDNDGNVDVVGLDPDANAFYVVFGDGAGNFAVDAFSQPLPDGGTEARMAVTNFNGAGADDFVGVNDQVFGSNASTFLGLGGANRRFQGIPFEAPVPLNGLVAGDFSRDGVPDLVFSDSSQLSFLVGNDAGDFSTSFGADGASDGVPRMVGAEVLKAADVDRDGLLDVVGLVSAGQSIQVGLNVSDQPTATPEASSPTPTPTLPGPTATPTIPPPTVTPTPIPTAGLGRCDYTVSNVTAPSTARGVVAANLNGTGGPDVAVSDGARVYVIYNDSVNALRQCARDHLDGAGPTDPPSSVMTQISGAGDLAVLDADGDGDLEIAVARPNRVSFLRRGGQNVFEEVAALDAAVPGNPVQISADYASNPIDQRRRAPLDLDGDGNTDLLVANDGANSISILYGNPGSSAFSVVAQPINARSRSVSAGDVTGDGLIDIVVATTDGRILYLVQGAPSDGRPTFSTRGTVNLTAPAVALQTGFFNDDAIADVFVADQTPAARIFVTASSLSSPTRVLAYALEDQPSAALTLLFDPIDARLDGVVSVPATDHVAFGLGGGDGGIARVLSPLATGPLPRDLAAADVDLDTQTDVVTANGDGTISILISSEPPPTPTPTITGTPTPTETPTMTGTETPTTPGTPTPSSTTTPATPTRAPTTPKPGTFQLSGGGCAVGDQGAAATPPVLLVGLVALLAARRRRGSVG